MGRSFPIGTVAGIRVQVHWSVAVIFGLIAVLLSTVTFPATYPEEPVWARVTAGVLTAAVFLLGLLAHELSHAVVARRNGIDVDVITLWLFGGVAHLKGEAKDPKTEFWVAGVGPLVSLGLGLVFAVIAAGVAAAGISGPLVGALTWLAAINVVLAVFNILPGAPLDGGRLLRAGLWRWRGDRTWATVIAARAGRGLGLALIALGLVQFLVAGGFGGLWLAFLGWFLIGAAALEEQHTQVQSALSGVRVGDVMTSDPQTVHPDATVAELVDRYLMRGRHSTFPLTEDGGVVGLVTLRRVKEVPAERRGDIRVRDVACPLEDVPQARPDEPLSDLVQRLNESADGRALVLEGETLVGIVSPSDISRAVERSSLRGGTRPGLERA